MDAAFYRGLAVVHFCLVDRCDFPAVRPDSKKRRDQCDESALPDPADDGGNGVADVWRSIQHHRNHRYGAGGYRSDICGEKMMPAKAKQRGDFKHFHTISTRWMDNDAYGHVNNVVYYSWFDTVVNQFLIVNGALDIEHSPVIGLVIETQCNRSEEHTSELQSPCN